MKKKILSGLYFIIFWNKNVFSFSDFKKNLPFKKVKWDANPFFRGFYLQVIVNKKSYYRSSMFIFQPKVA